MSAIDAFISDRDALSPGDRRTLRDAFPRYIDTLLLTGSVEAAIESMRTTAPPQAPGTAGARSLPGMVDIVFRSDEERATMHTAIASMHALIKEGDTALIPWMMQWLKIGLAAELQDACMYISDLAVPEMTADAAMHDLLLSLAAEDFSRGGRIENHDFLPSFHLRAMVSALTPPIYAAGLIRSVMNASVPFFGERSAHFDLVLFDEQSGFGRYPELSVTDADAAAMIRDTSPEKALFGIWTLWLRGGASPSLTDAIAEWIRRDPPHPGLIKLASMYLERTGAALSAPALTDSESLCRVLYGTPGLLAREAAGALASAASGTRRRYTPFISRYDGTSSKHIWEIKASLSPVPSAGTEHPPMAFYHRIIIGTSTSEWMPAQDEFGFIIAERDDIRACALPLRLPCRRASAMGAQRRANVLGWLPDTSEFLIHLSVPSKGPEWDTWNLILSVRANDMACRIWRPHENGPAEPIALTELRDHEDTSIVFSYGELKFHPGNAPGERFEEDRTPDYDSYSGPEIKRFLPGLAGDPDIIANISMDPPETAPAPVEYLIQTKGWYLDGHWRNAHASFIAAADDLGRKGFVLLQDA